MNSLLVLSFAVELKNGTDGSLDVAIDAVNAVRHPHHFLSITSTGVTSITLPATMVVCVNAKLKANLECYQRDPEREGA